MYGAQGQTGNQFGLTHTGIHFGAALHCWLKPYRSYAHRKPLRWRARRTLRSPGAARKRLGPTTTGIHFGAAL